MNSTTPTQWPADVVRVSHAPDGLLLHFPVLRGSRAARSLALTGLAMLMVSLYAGIAYPPASTPDAAALLTFALTAVVVYPVILFGALFLAVAVYTVANSLTVNVDATSINCVRRVLGVKYSERSLPTAAIAALEPEVAVAPPGLGGATFYRLAARSSTGAQRLIVAEGLPDETLCQALKALIEQHARLECVNR